MQERYDYESTKHKHAYERWERAILARCDELEKGAEIQAISS